MKLLRVERYGTTSYGDFYLHPQTAHGQSRSVSKHDRGSEGCGFSLRIETHPLKHALAGYAICDHFASPEDVPWRSQT